MSEKVIIVESPSKSHTISTYLGSGYTVLSSKGHICDLSTKGKDGLGIDIENSFTPSYVTIEGKEKLINDLKKACKGKQVYLATDPDREGEAIAYHLANLLNLNFNDLNRVEFHEITKQAVIEALDNPHRINLQMVDSQETRRMIDRILGFRLSTLLKQKIRSKSAGRVQSVALMLIVNLEKEILSFVPVKYYEIEGTYKKNKIKLNTLNNVIINDKNRIEDRKVLEDLKDSLDKFIVSNIENKSIKKASYPTYTTSTMQQDASNKLNFSPTKTMSVAQKLYEGKNIGSEAKGLITYMRTDSTRLADSFVKQASAYILANYGKEYLGSTKMKSQKGMQDAHEGIRPTDINITPDSIKEYLTGDEYKLYKLIYNRTLASLMSNATYQSKKYILSNTNSEWSMQGSTLSFDGYLKVYDREDKDEILPSFNIGDSFNADSINILDKETEPKKRYTEASIIKEMEDLGIGRPSTYATTLHTLKEREYIEVEKKTIKPTEQGILTTDKLVEFFSSIINVKYTAEMELDLDKIAKGEKAKLLELNEFYNQFTAIYNYAKDNMEKRYPIILDETCPECGHNLAVRIGKYGEFISCSNYPTCRYIKKNEEQGEIIKTDFLCPSCNQGHIIGRVASRGKSKGSIFYCCNRYPKCKTLLPGKPTSNPVPMFANPKSSIMIEKDNNEIVCYDYVLKKEITEHEEFIEVNQIKCPNCNKGDLILRTSTRGKNKGEKFYGCSNFPRCKTIISLDEYNKLTNK